MGNDRRKFLLDALKTSGQLVLASTTMYAIGSFVKSSVPDAGMLAGAKTCGWTSVGSPGTELEFAL